MSGRGTAVMAKSTFDKILEESMGVIGGEDDGFEEDDLGYGYAGGQGQGLGGERNRPTGGMGMVGAVGAAGDDDYPYYPRQDNDSDRESPRRTVNEEEVSSSVVKASVLVQEVVVQEVVVPPVRL